MQLEETRSSDLVKFANDFFNSLLLFETIDPRSFGPPIVKAWNRSSAEALQRHKICNYVADFLSNWEQRLTPPKMANTNWSPDSFDLTNLGLCFPVQQEKSSLEVQFQLVEVSIN